MYSLQYELQSSPCSAPLATTQSSKLGELKKNKKTKKTPVTSAGAKTYTVKVHILWPPCRHFPCRPTPVTSTQWHVKGGMLWSGCAFWAYSVLVDSWVFGFLLLCPHCLRYWLHPSGQCKHHVHSTYTDTIGLPSWVCEVTSITAAVSF